MSLIPADILVHLSNVLLLVAYSVRDRKPDLRVALTQLTNQELARKIHLVAQDGDVG
jgi:hypothetical protein